MSALSKVAALLFKWSLLEQNLVEKKMTPYNFCLLLFSFCTCMLGFLVWWKRQDSVGHKYLLVMIFSSFWAVFCAILMSTNTDYALALFSARTADAFGAFIGPAWYHFAVVYNDSKTRSSKIFLRVTYGVAIVIALFAYTPWFIPKMGPIGVFPYYPYPGPLYVCFTILFVLCVNLAYFELIKKMLRSQSDEKTATLGLIIASLFGFIGGGLTFLPAYRIDFPQYGIFVMPFHPLIISYFISRQNLFSLESMALAAHQQKLMEMGILSASIHHELKNPLYIIKSRAELFLLKNEEGSLKDAAQVRSYSQEGFTTVRDQAERAFQIVKRLTTFVRQKDFVQPVLEEVNLENVFADLEPLLRHELMSYKIEMKTDFARGVAVIKTDKGYLEEILFNLFLNAIQALKVKKQGGQIIFRSLSQAGKTVLEIEDNGPGISHEDLKKIFKPFYTTKEQGVGLGLYITSRLAERIGMKLHARSVLNQGTTFRMEFNE